MGRGLPEAPTVLRRKGGVGADSIRPLYRCGTALFCFILWGATTRRAKPHLSPLPFCNVEGRRIRLKTRFFFPAGKRTVFGIQRKRGSGMG